MMPNVFAPAHFEWRVPVDDVTTLSVIWFSERVAADREPYHQETIPHWWGRATDEHGRPVTTHVLGQDVMSWTGQGPITDRTKEHLGRSDKRGADVPPSPGGRPGSGGAGRRSIGHRSRSGSQRVHSFPQ